MSTRSNGRRIIRDLKKFVKGTGGEVDPKKISSYLQTAEEIANGSKWQTPWVQDKTQRHVDAVRKLTGRPPIDRKTPYK